MPPGSFPTRSNAAFRLVALPLLLLGLSSTVRAQEVRVSAAEARDHVGTKVTVCGTVLSPRYLDQGSHLTFLNLDRAYPEQIFTAVIFPSVRAQFRSPPEVAFADRRVCITGLVTLFRAAPQIVVAAPADVKLDTP